MTRSGLAVVHRALAVPTTVVDGIRVTTIARTLFDVVNRVHVNRLEAAMDASILSGKLSVEELVELAASVDRSRRPGIAVWRALVEEHAQDDWVVPESVLESALLVVVRRLGTDVRAVRQATLPWWSEGEGRVDVLLPEARTILEADGRRWHARVKDFDKDRWRDNVAQSHGYDVLRFTYLHLTQRPDEVLDLIVDTLRWKSVA